MDSRQKPHVLIVEDDGVSREILAFLSEDQGRVRVSQATSGAEMHAILRRDAANLIVLDLELPDENGLTLVRQLRSRSEVPIIVVTGNADRNVRLAALDSGVDDFLTKPFDLKELNLRIRNLLRRSMAVRRVREPESSPRIAFDRYILDRAERTLQTTDGEVVGLTANEFLILSALLKRRNASVSRGALLDAISDGGDDGPSERAIDIYITNLRGKLEADPKHPAIIRTVRGFGYRIDAREG